LDAFNGKQQIKWFEEIRVLVEKHIAFVTPWPVDFLQVG
jgi:hypothetical protein